MGPDERNGPLKEQLTMESSFISKLGALHFDKLCIMTMTNHKFTFGVSEHSKSLLSNNLLRYRRCRRFRRIGSTQVGNHNELH